MLRKANVRPFTLPLLLGLFACGVCRAEPPKTQTKFLYAHSAEPVLSLLNTKGEQYRPLALIAEAMFEEIGAEWEKLPLPVNRMYTYLDSGRANVALFIKSSRMDECCIRSKEPVYLARLGVYQQSTKSPVVSLDDLVGKSVIMISTYNFGVLEGFLADPENRISMFPVKHHNSAYSMLEAGRADYFLDYDGPAKKVEEEKQKNDIQYNVLQQVNVFIVLRKDYPDAKHVVEYLADVFRSVSKDESVAVNKRK